MRILICCFCVFTLLACTHPHAEISLSQLKNDVRILAGDSLQGRETGTAGEKMAADYLSGRFQRIGLTPLGTSGYLQPFFVKSTTNPHEQSLPSANDTTSGTRGMNVIGYLDNPGEQIIVIGAHYDHLGFGGFSSLFRGDSAIHNGADDNASGVAAMLAIAEALKESSIQNDVLFLAFSGEEKGLWGSNYFVKHPTVDLSKISCMINMDMVGRLDSIKGMVIYGTGTAKEWPLILDSTNTEKLKVSRQESGVGPSDHTSFYLQDIPVLHFFTGQHEDYHKPTDDWELINYQGIAHIAQYITNIIRFMDQNPPLTFQKTKDESQQNPRFTVTLGVVPDYLFDGTGMRIDGISEDKPAQRAGLLPGDVVIQMGDSVVTDMMSYMRALSAFNKGDTTEVHIKREDMIHQVKVVF